MKGSRSAFIGRDIGNDQPAGESERMSSYADPRVARMPLIACANGFFAAKVNKDIVSRHFIANSTYLYFNFTYIWTFYKN